MLDRRLAWTFMNPAANHGDELSWSVRTKNRHARLRRRVVRTSCGRSTVRALLLGWLWRIALLVVFFSGSAKLNLSFVPSHPDRLGGLGFLEKLPTAFAPVSLALSATIASRWAHEIVYHQQSVAALKLPAATFVVVWSLLLLAPFAPLMPLLRAAQRRVAEAYGLVAGRTVRLVLRRWIDGTTKAVSPLLEPDGVGVIADAAAMYNAVRSMRVLPIGKATLGAVLLPIVAPMLVVAALQGFRSRRCWSACSKP